MLLPFLSVLAFAAESGVTPEERAYLDRRITIEHYVSPTGVPLRTDYSRYEKLVLGPELYRLLDRPDLGEKYRVRNTVNWGMGLGGLAAVALGVTVVAVADEDTQAGAIASLGGMGLVLGGGVSIVIPCFRRAHPIPRDEIDLLVGKYNLAVAQDLGLAP